MSVSFHLSPLFPHFTEISKQHRSESERDAKSALERLRFAIERERFLDGIKFSDQFLVPYLISCADNPEKALGRISNYVSIVGQHPEVFNWDKSYEKVFQAKIIEPCLLGEERVVVVVCRVRNWNPEKVSTNEVLSAAVRFQAVDNKYYFAQKNGLHIIIDVSGMTLDHLRQFSLKKAMFLIRLSEGLIPIKLLKVHIIRAGILFYHLYYTSIKPFLRNKISKRLQILGNDLHKLYECCPKEWLPEDVGGFVLKAQGIDTADILKRIELNRKTLDEVWSQVRKSPQNDQ